MRSDVIWVNTRGGHGVEFGLIEVSQEEKGDFGQRGAGFGKRRVEFGGLLEGLLRRAQRSGRKIAVARAGEVALAFEQLRVSLRAQLARRSL